MRRPALSESWPKTRRPAMALTLYSEYRRRWVMCAGTLFCAGYSFNCDERFLKEIKLLDRFPFWPSLLSVLGPATLVAAFTRGDGVGAYAAGIIVTLIGWSQLARWYREHR